MSNTLVPVWRIVAGGERRGDSCGVPGNWSRQLTEIRDADLVFTAEILSTGHVNLCLEHPEHGDFMSRLASNDPDPYSPDNPRNVLFGMLRDWSKQRLVSWIEAQESA